MKINRVDINLPRKGNYHKPFFYNDALDFMKTAKVGGTISNDGVKMSGVPVNLLKLLNQAKIYFNKVKK